MFLFSLILLLPISINGLALDKTFDNVAQEHPYIVSIKVNGTHVCTGNMYKNRCVVTTARCVQQCFDGGTVADGNGNEVRIVNKTYHEKYVFNKFDVGVIIVDQNFSVQERLPIGGNNDDLKTEEPAEVLSYKEGQLIKYPVMVKRIDECEKDYGKYFDSVSETCVASKKSSSPCFIDFGAVLIQNNTHLGSASFCKIPHKQPKYTVFSEFPWVTMGFKQFDEVEKFC